MNSLTPSLYFSLDEPSEECQFPQLTADQKKVQKNKDQTCKELQLIFLGSEKQPLLNVNVNVILNVIAIFHGFLRFSHIVRNP